MCGRLDQLSRYSHGSLIYGLSPAHSSARTRYARHSFVRTDITESGGLQDSMIRRGSEAGRQHPRCEVCCEVYQMQKVIYIRSSA